MSYKLWDFFRELQTDYRLVDLTHPLDNDSPYWSGIPAGSVELGNVVFDWGNPMLECLIQTFKFPGQFGTHIDFPSHFIRGAASSESFGASNMIYPLCVVDISAKVAEDVHYAATSEDIKAYEKIYGTIPDGAFVALRTDWSRHWPDMNAISGIADDGSENFPGWSLDALEYIYETRNAAANGHETLDTDASVEAARTGDLTCERYILGKGKLQVEVLTNLNKVAAAGALVIVAWANIVGATGLPARVIAITPR